MYNNYKVDLKDSSKALNKIKPMLEKLFKSKIYDIETSENEVLIKLDQKSGIDYIKEDSTGLQGIAARVQWGNSWDTFTLREKRYTGTITEIEKRLEQIDKGYFYPAYTMQAYFDNRKENNLLSLGIVKTKDLYDLYKSKPNIFKRNKSDNYFKFISWLDLKKYINIYIYKKGD